ncbi:unnamed protein product [Ectocarpus sp. 4 AP-2014]
MQLCGPGSTAFNIAHIPHAEYYCCKISRSPRLITPPVVLYLWIIFTSPLSLNFTPVYSNSSISLTYNSLLRQPPTGHGQNGLHGALSSTSDRAPRHIFLVLGKSSVGVSHTAGVFSTRREAWERAAVYFPCNVLVHCCVLDTSSGGCPIGGALPMIETTNECHQAGGRLVFAGRLLDD